MDQESLRMMAVMALKHCARTSFGDAQSDLDINSLNYLCMMITI